MKKRTHMRERANMRVQERVGARKGSIEGKRT